MKLAEMTYEQKKKHYTKRIQSDLREGSLSYFKKTFFSAREVIRYIQENKISGYESAFGGDCAQELRLGLRSFRSHD